MRRILRVLRALLAPRDPLSGPDPEIAALVLGDLRHRIDTGML